MKPVNALYRMPKGHDPQWVNVTVLQWGPPTPDAQMQKALIAFSDGDLLWANLDRIRLARHNVVVDIV